MSRRACFRSFSLLLFRAAFLSLFGGLVPIEGQEQQTPEEMVTQIAALQQENASLRAQLAQFKQTYSVPPSSPPKIVPPPARSHFWSGNVSLGGSLDRGNTEDNSLNLTGEIDRNTSSDKLLNSFNGLFGTSKGVTTSQRITQATQYDDYLDKRWYLLVHETATYDALAGIRYRGIVGPGIGYYLIKTDKLFLNVELGITGEVQKLAGEQTTYSPLLLLANNFEYKINPTTRIFENIEFLPDVLDAENRLIDGHFGIETQIYKPFFLKFSINDLFNNQPPPNYKKNDLNAVTALVWKF